MANPARLACWCLVFLGAGVASLSQLLWPLVLVVCGLGLCAGSLAFGAWRRHRRHPEISGSQTPGYVLGAGAYKVPCVRGGFCMFLFFIFFLCLHTLGVGLGGGVGWANNILDLTCLVYFSFPTSYTWGGVGRGAWVGLKTTLLLRT